MQVSALSVRAAFCCSNGRRFICPDRKCSSRSAPASEKNPTPGRCFPHQPTSTIYRSHDVYHICCLVAELASLARGQPFLSHSYPAARRGMQLEPVR
eukprot:2883075-Pyramimonas_sp.AAC.1